MKKLLAFFLCLSMLLGAVAFAEEVKELSKEVMEGQTTVSLAISPEDNEVVVVIPATVEIEPTTQYGEVAITLKSGWKLVSVNELKVRIKEFANGASTSTSTSRLFKLKNAEGTTASYEIYYKLDTMSTYSTQAFNAVPTGDNYWPTKNLIKVTKSTSTANDRTASLKVNVPVLPTEPGEYTDVITFAIVLD